MQRTLIFTRPKSLTNWISMGYIENNFQRKFWLQFDLRICSLDQKNAIIEKNVSNTFQVKIFFEKDF